MGRGPDTGHDGRAHRSPGRYSARTGLPGAGAGAGERHRHRGPPANRAPDGHMRATSSVLRLDPDDELPAILDRLPARTPCVLVLPPHARALTSVVGAKLLSRRARTLDSAIAVVTDDHAMMAHARAAGVPVAQTVEEAQGLLGAAPAGAAREAARADRAFRRGKGARSVHPAEPDAAHDDAGPAAGAAHGAPRPPMDLGRA